MQLTIVVPCGDQAPGPATRLLFSYFSAALLPHSLASLPFVIALCPSLTFYSNQPYRIQIHFGFFYKYLLCICDFSRQQQQPLTHCWFDIHENLSFSVIRSFMRRIRCVSFEENANIDNFSTANIVSLHPCGEQLGQIIHTGFTISLISCWFFSSHCTTLSFISLFAGCSENSFLGFKCANLLYLCFASLLLSCHFLEKNRFISYSST